MTVVNDAATVCTGEVREAARRLELWCNARGWHGSDPYDGMNAPFLRRSLRRPLPLRLLTQAVKRSPLNLRPLLHIRPDLSSATLGVAISAYAHNGFMPAEVARERLSACIAAVQGLRCFGFDEPCWGYHFDVQTRVFFYPRTQPNTIATAFVALGLLDAFVAYGDEQWLQLAVAAGDFFLNHVPQTGNTHEGYFGYLPGDRTPIHNANMLVCAVLARLSSHAGRADFAHAAARGVAYTVARQRSDGSWPYGEDQGLGWVDGFHTGYVLDSLLTCLEHGVGDKTSQDAWQQGLHFYTERLIEADGTPRYKPESRYPVDGQCVAQAIETLSRASGREPILGARRWEVARYALREFAAGDGSFAFQREWLWTIHTPHVRWVQAPMLKALTMLIQSAGPDDR